MKQHFKTLKALIEREVWEHQLSFIKIPLILMAIICLIAICSAIYALAHTGNWHFHNVNYDLQTKSPHLALTSIFYGASTPFNIILWFILLNYFLSCLYDDRKDRSILFWHSMPISQSEFIFSKLFTGIVVAPIFSALCALITEIICLILFSITMSAKGFSQWTFLWEPSALAHALALQFYSIFTQISWLFPFIGWFMLCSAFSKKAPSIRAFVPLIGISIISAFFLTPDYFNHFIFTHLSQSFKAWFSALNHLLNRPSLFSQTSQEAENLIFSWIIGIIIGIGCIALAGYIRSKNHDS